MFDRWGLAVYYLAGILGLPVHVCLWCLWWPSSWTNNTTLRAINGRKRVEGLEEGAAGVESSGSSMGGGGWGEVIRSTKSHKRCFYFYFWFFLHKAMLMLYPSFEQCIILPTIRRMACEHDFLF